MCLLQVHILTEQDKGGYIMALLLQVSKSSTIEIYGITGSALVIVGSRQ